MIKLLIDTKLILVCIVASLGLVQTGMILSYPGIALISLQNHTRVSPVTVNIDEATWIASLATISTPFGCLLAGPTIDKFGRSLGIKLVNLPSLFGWMLIFIYPNLIRIYIGRFLCGISIGLSSIPSIVYIGEISTKTFRGPLLNLGSVAIATGVIALYLMGMIFDDDWQTVAGFGILLSTITIILNQIFLPESPIWLLSKGQDDEAEKSLKRLRDSTNESGFREEFIEMRKSVSANINQKTGWKSSIKNFCCPETYKPLIIMNTYFLFQQLVGISVTIIYAINFAKDAGIVGNFHLVAIGIGFVRLLSTLITTAVAKNYGRRTIGISTGLVTALCLFILSAYLYTYKNTVKPPSEVSWIPIVCLFIYVLMSCIGFSALPWSMIGEVYPIKVRGVASGLTACLTYLNCSILVKLYPYFTEMVGKQGVFLFAGTSALLGTGFLLFFLPETKGKTLEEIENYFKNKNDST